MLRVCIEKTITIAHQQLDQSLYTKKNCTRSVQALPVPCSEIENIFKSWTIATMPARRQEYIYFFSIQITESKLILKFLPGGKTLRIDPLDEPLR